MIEQRIDGDVESLRLTSVRSRSVRMSVRAFLVRNVLIDSGFPGAAKDLRQLLDTRGVRGAFITHQHEDHAGNVELLAAREIPLAIGADTLRLLVAPPRIAFYRRYTWSSSLPLRTAHVPFADESLELLAAPGHSPDHHVVWDHVTDTLFGGDLFVGVKVRVAHKYGDPRAEVQTLRALIDRKPARLFCAHRGLVPHAVATLRAKADWTESVIEHVDRLHERGIPADTIREQVLGKRGALHWFSLGEYSPDNLVQAIIHTA